MFNMFNKRKRKKELDKEGMHIVLNASLQIFQKKMGCKMMTGLFRSSKVIATCLK